MAPWAGACAEAAECIRELIEEIQLVPENGKLKIKLYGELAALLNLANGQLRLLTTVALPSDS
jgi:hypothetical protein